MDAPIKPLYMIFDQLTEEEKKEVQDLIISGEWTQETTMETPNPALHVWILRTFPWKEKTVTITRTYSPPFGDPDFGTFTETIEIE